MDENKRSEFLNGEMTIEDGFWTMFYFLKSHYDLSNNTFDVSDILSASEPFWDEKRPADSGMIDFWNEALENYRKEGRPPIKQLNR